MKQLQIIVVFLCVWSGATRACLRNVVWESFVFVEDSVSKSGKGYFNKLELSNMPVMVQVEGGRFQMGSSGVAGEEDEYPKHWVNIGAFKMAKYETSVAEFRAFVKATSYITDVEREGYGYVYMDGKVERVNGVTWECGVDGKKHAINEENQPVIFVSWNDAMAYCQWLSNKTGIHYDLPSEAQWEYAAKWGIDQNDSEYLGSDDFGSKAWYGGNSSNITHPVGQKAANSLEIYDMSGNVYEWCHDWYDSKCYTPKEVSNPVGPKRGKRRVLRGGSWAGGAELCRTSNRNSNRPNNFDSLTGFRVIATR